MGWVEGPPFCMIQKAVVRSPPPPSRARNCKEALTWLLAQQHTTHPHRWYFSHKRKSQLGSAVAWETIVETSVPASLAHLQAASSSLGPGTSLAAAKAVWPSCVALRAVESPHRSIPKAVFDGATRQGPWIPFEHAMHNIAPPIRPRVRNLGQLMGQACIVMATSWIWCQLNFIKRSW